MWLKDNTTWLFNITLLLCFLFQVIVDYMRKPKEDPMVSCKLTHYVTQSSNAESFSTIHVFFICGSVLKFQRNTYSSQIWRISFWNFHTEELIQLFQQFRKPCFWKFLCRLLVSTLLKLLIIAFHSALKQNTALSDSTDCLLLS